MNSLNDHAGVLAETQWLNYLAERDFAAPKPIRRLDGEFVSQVFVEPLGKSVDAVLYSWLPGSLVADAPTVQKWLGVGELMARLHIESKDFKATAPAILPRVDDALMKSVFVIPTHEHPSMTDELRELASWTLDRCNQILATVDGELQPIHTDMHGHNIMSNRGKLSVFDFDDAGIGYPIQDLANATFYLRDEPAFEDALKQGYSTVAELPQMAATDFDGLACARSVLILNDLLDTTNAENLAIVPSYSQKVLWRLKNYRDTGRFALAPS